MKTNEVEKALGLTKHAILYYEKEGLITPKRNDNGYRNYDESDLQTLQLIKFLRNIDISIDDIKAILTNELSFDNCLEIRNKNLNKSISELQTMQHTIAVLKEKHVPLIPTLEKIELIDLKKGLGYRKTSATVAYNRPITKAMAIKQILIAAFFAYAFTLGTYLFLSGKDMDGFFLVLFIFTTYLIIFTGMNVQLMMHIYDKSRNQSIEFLEEGIRIYKRLGYLNHLKYILAALIDRQDKYQTFYHYDQINKLEIMPKHRYTPLYVPGASAGIALSTSMYEVDLKFYFSDGQTYFLLGPTTYDKDSQFIGYILEAKVKNIVDKQNILYAYQNNINLTDYLLK